MNIEWTYKENDPSYRDLYGQPVNEDDLLKPLDLINAEWNEFLRWKADHERVVQDIIRIDTTNPVMKRTDETEEEIK